LTFSEVNPLYLGAYYIKGLHEVHHQRLQVADHRETTVAWGLPLGQLRNPENKTHRVEFWRLHAPEEGQTTGQQALTYSSLLRKLVNGVLESRLEVVINFARRLFSGFLV
jgi:hypothetical protein